MALWQDADKLSLIHIFESDQLLAKAGGEVAAKEVEEKLQTIYDKIGLTLSLIHIFAEDLIGKILSHLIIVVMKGVMVV